MKMTDKKDEKNNSTTKETEKPEQLTDEKLEDAAGGCLIPLSKKQTEKM